MSNKVRTSDRWCGRKALERSLGLWKAGGYRMKKTSTCVGQRAKRECYLSTLNARGGIKYYQCREDYPALRGLSSVGRDLLQKGT